MMRGKIKIAGHENLTYFNLIRCVMNLKFLSKFYLYNLFSISKLTSVTVCL